MKTIIIKTQAELDALPDSFSEFTVIEIRSDPATIISINKARDSSSVEAYGSSRVVAYGSSRVVAYGSSRVDAWDSSRVVAWDSSRVVAYGSSRVDARGSSRVVAFDFAAIQMLSILVTIKLFNYSVVSVRGFKPKTKIIKKHKTATIIKTPERIERSFNEWLRQGYIHADGITKKLISKKKIGNVEVFEVEEFLERASSFVVKNGNVFSHGKTIKEAKESLKYKISNRDTSEFKKWKLNDLKKVGDLIRAYRAITGACEFGTKQFCESIKLKEKYTVKEVIKLTEGKYGNKEFSEFFGRIE